MLEESLPVEDFSASSDLGNWFSVDEKSSCFTGLEVFPSSMGSFTGSAGTTSDSCFSTSLLTLALKENMVLMYFSKISQLVNTLCSLLPTSCPSR